MMEKPVWHLPFVFLAFCASLLLVKCSSASNPNDLLTSIKDIDMLPHAYRQIIKDIQSISLPAAPQSRIDVASFTPFCSNMTKYSNVPEIEPECLRWEEHELDMLLMYIDLIAVGMQKTLAKKFYEEIRCLSRSNIRPILSLNAWEVCFFYDFSEVVGKLLGKYVAEDESLLSTVRLPSTMSAKFLYGQTTPQGGSFLLNLFRDASHFRIYEPAEQKIQTSCCVSCIQDNYFLNIARDVCISDPFGKHCCHKACKSLGRLKIGASSSTNYCCEKITPMTCVR